MFPPAPESRDTSGVVIGASGYGFIPPGVREIVQGRGKTIEWDAKSNNNQNLCPYKIG